MLSRTGKLGIAAATIAAVSLAIFAYQTPELSPAVVVRPPQVKAPAVDGAQAPTLAAPVAANIAQPSSEQSVPSGVSSKEIMAGQEASDRIAFKLDAGGHIVTDEQARLNIEKLFALNTPEQRTAKQRELEDSLSPGAAREFADLMERYDNYQSASRQALPPGREMTTAEEGINEIEAQHTLRVQYFGADVAAGFFGSEEKVQRELLRLISLEKDQSMSMEEKALKAQALYQPLTEDPKP